MGPIPSRWKGTCMEGLDFNKSNCNRKLIGAKYYNAQLGSIQPSSNGSLAKQNAFGTPRDPIGHGTHTSSTAAGSMVSNADFYGLAQGVAKGGSPTSRIAMYKACFLDNCPLSTILKAIDDAINDGVDIISISIGTVSHLQTDFLNDPLAIGAFHANQRGVLVVCSGGNEGPHPFTVVNTAPWILTVAASSIDRIIRSTIVLGNGNMLKGYAINFSNLSRFESYPLVFGRDAAIGATLVSEASNCRPGSIDTIKVDGKIIVCVNVGVPVTRNTKILAAQEAGAKGLILIDDLQKENSFYSGDFPFSQVGKDAGTQIFKYMNYTKKPTAVILPSEDVKEFKPAPTVADFSSRGPGGVTEGILKPDLMAPGVNILAAGVPNIVTVPQGKKPSNFVFMSGTSMACPHVAGASAFLKSAHPWWSPSMIRSALMTTAITTNNLGEPITSYLGANATFHEMGAGVISPLRALNPGLVFETTVEDYLYFLCDYGYKIQAIRSISGTNFTCPSSSPDLISSINYPSISIAKLERKVMMRGTRRTVTNVGPPNSTYIATVDAPNGIKVIVTPDRLTFTRRWMKATYLIVFNANSASEGYGYGSITWSDGAHTVRTVFAVNVV